MVGSRPLHPVGRKLSSVLWSLREAFCTETFREGACKSLAFTLYFLSFQLAKAKLSHGVFLAFTTHTLFCRLLTPLGDENRRPNFVVYFLILLVYQT